GAPIVVVWDNLNTHRAAGMRKYAADHDWLTITTPPPARPRHRHRASRHGLKPDSVDGAPAARSHAQQHLQSQAAGSGELLGPQHTGGTLPSWFAQQDADGVRASDDVVE
ncbi:hypothetical protein ABZ460_42560, partial [Streptomyces fagopyri]